MNISSRTSVNRPVYGPVAGNRPVVRPVIGSVIIPWTNGYRKLVTVLVVLVVMPVLVVVIPPAIIVAPATLGKQTNGK